VGTVAFMSFPEGPPPAGQTSDEPQRYATDGRDAEGTVPTASAEDSTTAALASDDPSATPDDSTAPADGAETQLDDADRDQTDQDDEDEKRAYSPGGALGPGNTATGAGTALG
jgi:hypothetical protein